MTPKAKKILDEASRLGPEDRIELVCRIFEDTDFVVVDAAHDDISNEFEDRLEVLALHDAQDSLTKK